MQRSTLLMSAPLTALFYLAVAYCHTHGVAPLEGWGLFFLGTFFEALAIGALCGVLVGVGFSIGLEGVPFFLFVLADAFLYLCVYDLGDLLASRVSTTRGMAEAYANAKSIEATIAFTLAALVLMSVHFFRKRRALS